MPLKSGGKTLFNPRYLKRSNYSRNRNKDYYLGIARNLGVRDSDSDSDDESSADEEPFTKPVKATRRVARPAVTMIKLMSRLGEFVEIMAENKPGRDNGPGNGRPRSLSQLDDSERDLQALIPLVYKQKIA